MTTVMHAANFLDLLSFCKREISTQISNTYVQIGQFWRRNTMELKNLWNYTYIILKKQMSDQFLGMF